MIIKEGFNNLEPFYFTNISVYGKMIIIEVVY